LSTLDLRAMTVKVLRDDKGGEDNQECFEIPYLDVWYERYYWEGQLSLYCIPLMSKSSLKLEKRVAGPSVLGPISPRHEGSCVVGLISDRKTERIHVFGVHTKDGRSEADDLPFGPISPMRGAW